jgi:hypothetical protein
MRESFDRYILELRKHALDDQTEHTGRSALEALLNSFAEGAGNGIRVQHEPRRVPGKGAPDFKITKGGLILGYVENKGIGEPLDKVLKSEQIKKYRSLSQNIILTDYLHFIWINKDGIQRETLCHETDLEYPKFRLRDESITAVARLLEGFFSTAPEGIGRSQQLALELATRSRLLHDYLGEELVRQEREHKEARLYGLFQIFRDQVFHELTLSEFADAFAQMLAYGLFLARLNSDSDPVTLHNAREHVPGSFQLIRELVDFLTELEKDEYRDVRWVVEEVLSIVNALDLPAIHRDLSFRRRKAISRKVRAADEDEHRLFERDPFIYFYEDYLKAYDAATRKGRGVYYTPPPIVNFIVRAVDDILKDTFGISDGLADHSRVTVLDFACGTGTFLLEVFQRIFDNIGGPDAGRAEPIVREHLLTNVFGFEYLIAPYTIAHLKLSQYLLDQGHALKSDERLQVFLTNTLEPIHPEPNFLLPAITAEAEAAQTVKDRPILVITGNPPYSGHSKNKGLWISGAIGGYKFTMEMDGDGREVRRPLGERNPKWLNDEEHVVPILYRPFDDRWTYYTGKSSGFLVRPRQTTMRHMLNGENVGLITSRLTKGETFQHAQVTDHICEVICMSPKTSNNGFLFPLYLYAGDGTRSENFSPRFRGFIDARYEHHYTPEEILGTIYAVLHAPTYRARYHEFLRVDFPRVQLPESADNFEALSLLGWALIQAHLLRELPRRGLGNYHGKGDHAVEAVRYSPEERAVWINKTQSFKPVPQTVWDFHVGGYQVLDKYLKSRKGRVLSLNEINHVAAIADSLAFTIEQMAKIDEAYKKAFPERG